MKTGTEGSSPGQVNGEATPNFCGSFTRRSLTRDQEKAAAGLYRAAGGKGGVM